jgi:translation initiation factor 1
MADGNSKLVYSTGQAILRTRHSLQERKASEVLQSGLDSRRRGVTVRLDRKARSGKSVTVIEGLRMSQSEMEALLKKWKAGFGAGGTVKDAAVEIQGDHCKALIADLKKMGYAAKRCGG